MIRWPEKFNSGDMAFLLVASVVQLLFVWPGLCAIYCGMFRRRNITDICQRFPVVMAALSLTWVLWAYSLAFAPSPGSVPTEATTTATEVESEFQSMMEIEHAKKDETKNHGRRGVIGGFDYANHNQHLPMAGSERPVFPSRRPFYEIPSLLFLVTHMMLFVTAPAPLLVFLSGRIRWGGVLVFSILWGTLVYSPLVHWNWGDGWLESLGFLDSSGGLLHIGVGFSALACSIFLKSHDQVRLVDAPEVFGLDLHSILLSGGTLAFWGGSAVVHSALLFHLDGRVATAFLNTHLAACAGGLTWITISSVFWQHKDQQGFYAGALCGIVAIASNCGFVVPQSAMIIGGMVAACCCSVFQFFRVKGQCHESVYLIVLQGLAGVGGSLLAGLFATSSVSGLRWDGRAIEGLVEGNLNQLTLQAVGISAAAGWAFVGTLLIMAAVSFLFSNKSVV